MAHPNLGAGGDGESLAISSLPATALQAIYHAVTGKTENLSKRLRRNVLIKGGDIDVLFGMLNDQLGHYKVLAAPTVTVVVKHDNSKAVTYSSWERFKTLQVNNHEITSEISLKLEFILNLPNTNEQAQRCVININLDSALPVMKR